MAAPAQNELSLIENDERSFRSARINRGDYDGTNICGQHE